MRSKQLGRPRLVLGIVAALLCGTIAGSAAAAPETTPLSIRTRDGRVLAFVLEMADDADERKKGLMHRESLPEDGGMLFDFGTSRNVGMWMKDTLIPLDMLFVASDGEILSIAENARPGSLRRIGSGAPVRGVVEIAGGRSRQMGIEPGDRVYHAIFKNFLSLPRTVAEDGTGITPAAPN